MKKERFKSEIDNSIAFKWPDYPAKSVIVFVHGLGGHPQGTWGAFPHLIMGSSIGQNFDVISYGYSSDAFGPHSPDIASLIGELFSFCQSELGQYEMVAFISHSLGAVLVTGALLEYEKLSLPTRKFLTHIMITPAFFGGGTYARISPSRTARQLAKGSQFLKKLSKIWIESSVKTDIKSFLIFGTRDRIVTSPGGDISEFGFMEYRIPGDHIQSPKVNDIDNALYRGVLFVIERALRFDSRDSRKYFINMIVKTDKSDWAYDSTKEEWVLLEDFRFSIVELGSEKRDCFFNENFMDPSATLMKYGLRFNEIVLYEFELWYLDSHRYLIPAPTINSDEEREIPMYKYRLAKILEAGGIYKNLNWGLEMARIKVNEENCVVD